MKINIKQIKSKYQNQISLAIANNYEAVMIPLECEYDLYCLDNIDDEEYILALADDYGWDKFILIDLIKKEEQIFDLYKLEVA
ncbi:MAG TPA: hypothetical protein EYG73_00575 [Arcobacter sp.]|nr:hypothetical protein [Arcobacter sp.]